tara:strand:+ start:2234 stop:2650 length:417 start_codon:yes stop_codon:yes gene_type:complete
MNESGITFTELFAAFPCELPREFIGLPVVRIHSLMNGDSEPVDMEDISSKAQTRERNRLLAQAAIQKKYSERKVRIAQLFADDGIGKMSTREVAEMHRYGRQATQKILDELCLEGRVEYVPKLSVAGRLLERTYRRKS